MKNLKISLLAIGMLFGCAFGAKAQTADEVIKKHIDATGGLDNWKKINTLKINGSANAQGAELPITLTTINGKASRMEFTFNGMTCYAIVTNKEGWTYFPIQGQQKPEAMTPEQVKEQQDQLDLQGPLIDYQAKGNKVAYLGKDDVEGTECYKLKVTHPDGKEETMYIDATNYYHIRSIEKTNVNGKEMEMTINYSNYQKLPEGIVFPMTMDQGMGPMTVKSVEINKPVDESIFKPVAAATGK